MLLAYWWIIMKCYSWYICLYILNLEKQIWICITFVGRMVFVYRQRSFKDLSNVYLMVHSKTTMATMVNEETGFHYGEGAREKRLTNLMKATEINEAKGYKWCLIDDGKCFQYFLKIFSTIIQINYTFNQFINFLCVFILKVLNYILFFFCYVKRFK